ncbi:hypothetical protein [Burkholderia aenigmatica]|uniref:hypothetical protein n=1 Tax=Burkholderia aenigmatica TaxID=2015348 RepID=UPI00264A828D|nr:hypothetical protein [Burkholderia aenigmatica]MDN7880098.1 hypothetical protein [Burkholderia aenigmatica]
MDRKQFRKARVAVNRETSTCIDFTEYEVRGVTAARRLQGQHGDILSARMSNFTPDARSRINVYPLR